jgi:hypothetical protein
MHQEKFTHRQLQEYAVKKRLSRYYIHLKMKRLPNRRYYGTECCTLQRILFRQLQSVVLDGERGLANCHAIEQRYRGRYEQATIYQRQGSGGFAPIIEYADGGAPVHHLHQPAPVVRMRVVHNSGERSITFINQQAA